MMYLASEDKMSQNISDKQRVLGQQEREFHFHVGMRNFKTALAATLCALLYFPINRNPTFACIGAIFGMGRDLDNSKENGGNRLFGTIIGGIIGMALFHLYVQFYPEGGVHPLLFIFLFVGIVYLVLVCQVLFWPGAIQPGGVVLCIILFNTPVDTYIQYSMNRIFDTAIGVLIALLINIVLSPKRVRHLRRMLHYFDYFKKRH